MFEPCLERLWDADGLPPRERFDPRDEAQFNLVARHLLHSYWRWHDVEAFAALCGLARGPLLQEARATLGPTAPPDAVRELVDETLGRLFATENGRPPCVLHLRAYARSLMENARAAAGPRPADRLGLLAAVE